MQRSFTFALLFAVLALPAAAQRPDADWRTIELPHFRVHYPVQYESWAMRAAERLESIRTAVSAEVGFTPPQTIDVIVMNPIAEPNGVAWPFLDTPRMIFFAEPPAPDEQLGAFGHWIDLLAVHETAHLVHMLRPSRNPLERALEKSILPLNPITLHAPRWVLEGYATVVEGRLTGAGRPTSTIRALILRRWAENGRLPTYGQLNSDQRFLGMSMAYLMGSAYLEWLEQRAGAGSLRNLWARMTARQRRSFDESFVGVFGDRPDRLYGQFLAEVTASALVLRKTGALQEGSLFQETTRASGDPAVSPDGKQIAVVLRPKDLPERLVIWSTAAPSEEQEKDRKRIEKILARDPEDIAPVRVKPLPRKGVHELTMPDGGDIDTPRWTRDGKALLFSHRAPDADGVLHFDLYRWDFDGVQRITHLADVRDADPIDDRKAVAVRSRFGASQLVDVDLQTGAVTPRTEASIDDVFTHPRISADGQHLAYVAHRGGRWALFVDGEVISVPGDPASPEWLGDGQLVVTVFSRGFAEIHRVTLTGETTPLTRTAGGAFDAAPANDGRLFFMSLDPDGYVVRVLDAMTPAPAAPSYDATLVPAIPPLAGPAADIEPQTVTGGKRYGLGRQELSWFTSQNFAPEQRSTEIGIRMGDVVGRLDALLLTSFAAKDLPEGVALAAAWRGWPVELHAHAYHAQDDDGAELRAVWSRRFPAAALTIEGGALSDELVFGSARLAVRQYAGALRFDEAVQADVDDDHYRGIVSASVRSGAMRIGARYQHDGGARVALGGLASSLLPRSAYALRVLDPALPPSTLSGESYNGWRIEAATGSLPFTLFYQRHELDSATLSLAGAEVTMASDPLPILKVPGLHLTLGAARIFDAPLRGDTKWWLGMRWRP